MSGIQGSKAISMVSNGKIEERPARVFRAIGSDGETEYTQVVFSKMGGGEFCTCPARVGCYHLIAAHLLMSRGRDGR